MTAIYRLSTSGNLYVASVWNQMSTIYEVCVEECDFEKLERGRYRISVVERGFDHEGNRFSV